MSKKRVKAATRHKRLKLAGIASMGGYGAVLAAQRGGCAICGRPPKVRRLNVDHDHITGRVRGLLCARCNRGLGWFGDSPVLLDTAAVYLRWGHLTACAHRDAMQAAKVISEDYAARRLDGGVL